MQEILVGTDIQDIKHTKNVKSIMHFMQLSLIVEYGLNTNHLLKLSCKNTAQYKSKIVSILNTNVIISNKLKSCAGKASSCVIKLHPGMFNPEDHLYSDRIETFLHELAHVVGWYSSGKMCHGLPWQFAMVCFGFAKPKKYYNPNKFNYKGYKDRQTKRRIAHIEKDLGSIF